MTLNVLSLTIFRVVKVGIVFAAVNIKNVEIWQCRVDKRMTKEQQGVTLSRTEMLLLKK